MTYDASGAFMIPVRMFKCNFVDFGSFCFFEFFEVSDFIGLTVNGLLTVPLKCI
jgi:hypothetical protein